MCDKDVSDACFARIRNGDGWVKLCSSECAMRYYDSLRSPDDSDRQPSRSRDERCHFFVNGECWA